jgi:hypothetical protein
MRKTSLPFGPGPSLRLKTLFLSKKCGYPRI